MTKTPNPKPPERRVKPEPPPGPPREKSTRGVLYGVYVDPEDMYPKRLVAVFDDLDAAIAAVKRSGYPYRHPESVHLGDHRYYPGPEYGYCKSLLIFELPAVPYNPVVIAV